MKRIAIIAALLLSGCSHTGTMPGAIHPDIFQKKVTQKGWVVVHTKMPDGSPAGANGLAIDDAHKVWTIAGNSSGCELDKILMNGYQQQFPLSACSFSGLVFGPDHNFWLAGQGAVARVTPTGQETDFSIGPSDIGASGITNGPDGNIWFGVCQQYGLSGGIGRMDLAGNFTYFPSSCQTNIAVGPDGNIWTSYLGDVTVTDLGGKQLHDYKTGGVQVYAMLTAPDRAVYLTQLTPNGQELVRIALDGNITHYSGGRMFGMAIGPDGNLWIANPNNNSTVTQFDIAQQQFGQVLQGPTGLGSSMLTGPDGNLWATAARSVDAYIIQLMATNPKTMTLLKQQQAPVTVSEANYAGPWTAVSSNLNVAMVTPNSQTGTFTVTAVGPGKCSIQIYDSMFNSIKAKVTVN